MFLNKNFLRNNFSACCCIFILSLITLTQNTILRQQHQVEFNTSHINTRIASVNVGKFYRIFTFRFSFWALFDMQQMNFIWEYVFLIIPHLHSKFTTQRVTKVLFSLWKYIHHLLNGLRAANSDSLVKMMRLNKQNQSSQDYE